MATNLATLVLKFVGDTTGLLSTFKDVANQTKAAGAGFGPMAMASAAGNLAAMGISKAIETSVDLVKSLAEGFYEAAKAVAVMGSEMERAQTAFETLVGSTTKGRALFQDIQKLATETPFGAKELVKEGRVLLGYGLPAKELVDVMRQLGDVASGTGGDVHHLALAYGQVLSKGKLTAEEMNRQLGNAGVSTQDLARGLGVSTAKFVQMMHDGEISASMFQKAFKTLNSPGGRFFGAMDRDLQTVGGRWDQLTETIQLSIGRLGLELFERFPIGKIIQKATDLLASIDLKGIGQQIEDFLKKNEAVGESIFRIVGGIGNLGKQLASSILPDSSSVGTVLKGIVDMIPSLIKGFIAMGRVLVDVAITAAKAADAIHSMVTWDEDVLAKISKWGQDFNKKYNPIQWGQDAFDKRVFGKESGYTQLVQDYNAKTANRKSANDLILKGMDDVSKAMSGLDVNKAMGDATKYAQDAMRALKGLGRGGVDPVSREQEIAMAAVEEARQKNKAFLDAMEKSMPGFKKALDGVMASAAPSDFFAQARAITMARGNADAFGGNKVLDQALLNAFKGAESKFKNTNPEPIATAMESGSAAARSAITSAIAQGMMQGKGTNVEDIWQRMEAEQQKQLAEDKLQTEALNKIADAKFGMFAPMGGN